MENLFTEMDNAAKMAAAPLAVRMRPRTLDELAGQQHAVGPGSWLFAAIASDALSSVILFGPAGTGKTSIAHIIAESTKAAFVEVSAIGGTVSDLRQRDCRGREAACSQWNAHHAFRGQKSPF